MSLSLLRRIGLFAVVLLALPVALACQSASDSTATPQATAPAQEIGSPEWSVISTDVNAVLATPDLGVGEQRFALVLSTLEGLVRFPVVDFKSYRYPDGFDGEREGPVETARARFTEFPLATRGIHVTQLDFDRTGNWSVEAHVPKADGTTSAVEVRFSVAEEPRSVAVGQPVPRSHNRTLGDVSDISKLTTGSFHDEELYRYSIADAVDRQRPFVVVFASPAFCTNAVCGPQVEVVSDLRETYGEQADFIHVDIYENPDEIQGDLDRAVVTPLLNEWGLTPQEWTYVVSSDGTVLARFENFVGADELSGAIELAISASPSV